MRADHGAEGLFGQHFQQDGVRNAAIDDVHRVDAGFGGFQRGRDFGQHAAGNGAVGEHVVDFMRGEIGEQFALLVHHPGNIGEQQQLFGAQHFGQLARHYIGVDVERGVVLAEADGRDNRNELIVLQRLDYGRVDGRHFAHLAHVDLGFRILAVAHAQFARANQAAVSPGQSHRLAASVVDQADDVLLHLAGQHPFHHFHGFVVGHAHALHEGTLLAHAAQSLVDLRAAAMHHHRVHAHQLEQHHVLGKVLLQGRVGHGVAAVFDDQSFAVKFADIGQGLGEDFGFFAGGDMRQIGEVGGRVGGHGEPWS